MPVRNFISLIIASLVFQIVAHFTVVLIGLLRGTDPFQVFFVLISAAGFWQCVLTTLLIHSLIYLLTERWFVRLAGVVTMRLRPRYALAYALFLLTVACVFFLPFSTDLWQTSLGVVAIGFVAAFVGGYVRGMLIDHWTGGGHVSTMPV